MKRDATPNTGWSGLCPRWTYLPTFKDSFERSFLGIGLNLAESRDGTFIHEPAFPRRLALTSDGRKIWVLSIKLLRSDRAASTATTAWATWNCPIAEATSEDRAAELTDRNCSTTAVSREKSPLSAAAKIPVTSTPRNSPVWARSGGGSA